MSEKDGGPRLCMIVAAYNEQAIIKNTISELRSILEQRPEVDWELILVNDGSSDNTGTIIDEAQQRDPRIIALHHKRNYGQGRALRTAFARSLGSVVVTMDADLSYSPECIWQLVDELDESGADMVLASAYMKGGSVANVPFKRLLFSWGGNLFLSAMLGGAVRTVTCVVRAYRREALESLYLESDGMELQYEIVRKALLMGFTIREVPGSLKWRAGKQIHSGRVSKMPIGKTMKMSLKFGWHTRPALAFILAGSIVMIPGLYMAGWLVVLMLGHFKEALDAGTAANWAVSIAFRKVFAEFTYSVVFSGLLILAGMLLLFFSFMILQSKYYFEETYRMEQHLMSRLRRLEEEIKSR